MIKNLAPREKYFLIGGLAFLSVLFIWFVLLAPYFRTMEDLDRRLAAHRRSLTKIQQMSQEIEDLRQKLATVGSHRSGQRPLFAQVENLTERTGVREQLLSMRPQPETTQGQFRQQLVEIRLEKLSLVQLVKLLYAIEFRSGGVQVKSMRVRPRFEDRSSLDVNMVLMSLESA